VPILIIYGFGICAKHAINKFKSIDLYYFAVVFLKS